MTGESVEPRTAAEVYNDLGQAYESAFREQPSLTAALEHLLPLLPSRARVLDLGCGTGRPVAATLAAAGHLVSGYDVAEKMVSLARTNVPSGRFDVADMRTLDLAPGSGDVVVLLFSLLQMSHEDQRAVLEKAGRWLAPGGFLLYATVPHPLDADGLVTTWMGHPVQTFSFPADRIRTLVAASGLEIVHDDETVYDPATHEAGVEHQIYLIARKT